MLIFLPIFRNCTVSKTPLFMSTNHHESVTEWSQWKGFRASSYFKVWFVAWEAICFTSSLRIHSAGEIWAARTLSHGLGLSLWPLACHRGRAEGESHHLEMTTWTWALSIRDAVRSHGVIASLCLSAALFFVLPVTPCCLVQITITVRGNCRNSW